MATIKQQKLAKKVSENISNDGKQTKPMGALMIESGYSKSFSKTPRQVTRSEAFKKLLSKSGVTDNKLTIKIKEGLDATKVISCNVIAQDSEGMKDADSMTKDFVDVEDYATRHKYLVTALELKGLIARNGFNLHIGDKNLNVTNNKILIHRSPNHRPLKNVIDVKVKGKDNGK